MIVAWIVEFYNKLRSRRFNFVSIFPDTTVLFSFWYNPLDTLLVCFDVHDKLLAWRSYTHKVPTYNYCYPGPWEWASSGGLFATTTAIIVTVIPCGWHRLLGRPLSHETFINTLRDSNSFFLLVILNFIFPCS